MAYPLSGRAIRDGHRALLKTLREFADGFDRRDHPSGDAADVAAAVAFLRHSLIPFARLEEESLDGCVELAEDTAFEHAFLAAETDALAAAVDAALSFGGASSHHSAEPVERVRRCLHRIEAVLEMHMLKTEDRESLLSAPPVGIVAPNAPGEYPPQLRRSLSQLRSTAHNGRPPPGEANPTRTESARAMSGEECGQFLSTHEWGMLCTVDDAGQPYAVPVSYGFDRETLFVATGPGRKARNLDANPLVCLTVAEIVDTGRWSSVVVTGEASWLDDVRSKLHAFNILRRQRSPGTTLSLADLARLRQARIARIRTTEITGRRR